MRHLKVLLFAVMLAIPAAAHAGDAEHDALRAKANKEMQNGNWKDAYDTFKKLAHDPVEDPAQVGADLNSGISCLQNLGRQDEIDDFREKTIAVHAKNWRLLSTAAWSYNNTEHYGFIVAGKYHRGNHRGGGEYSNSFMRDRIRALQLMTQATQVSKEENDKLALSDFYVQFARLLSNEGYNQDWRLQYLSDLTQLPDYETGYGYNYYGGGNVYGAPVDADGNPVYYKLPKTYETAASDGERWRWCLMQAVELNPGRNSEIRYIFAEFLRRQFDVVTMAGYAGFFELPEDDAKKNESGAYAVSTLTDDETIARLASGIKRFKLPDEFNFIRIFKEVAADPQGAYAQHALAMLAQTYEDRQQYDKAAEIWKEAAKRFGNGYQARLDQIAGNWGQFENSMTQPAGDGAAIEFRFRNANKVSFTAQEIDVEKLLGDVKAMLTNNPKQLDWNKLNISNIGYRLVDQNERQYLGAQAAAWDLELTPRAKHYDRRITVQTPLKKAGAYLLTAHIAGGNSTRVVIWVADTAIVEKPMDNAMYYFVADATTGKPIPNAKIDAFGYQQNWNNNALQINTKSISGAADAEGQYFLKWEDVHQNYQWLITASTAGGHFSFLGFQNIWRQNYYDAQYNQVKGIVITDRPVYRPAQPVRFKIWVGHAQYDAEGKSFGANQQYSVVVHNPKGEKFFEKTFKTDEFGGLDGSLDLPKEATLGVYFVNIPGVAVQGNFRVEEYKKPEFEVKVDAPADPVMLGEKITATINARYYFGAPVVDAKVKYKILRHEHSAQWYPVGQWDWFYEPGYWWFAYDYPWYPGWREWGCRRPWPWWWGHAQPQPELVAEREVAIGADGTFKVEIDTAIAKAVHGDTDHRYEISAEVTDASRRTIVGSGRVMVARKPFKVYAWVDRGHYHAGDPVHAQFSAQTLDSKPVKGKGVLRLLKISYNEKKEPSEAEVQKWDLDTDDEGRAQLQLKASEAGQYRLSYKVADSKNHEIEGAYIFTASGQNADGSEFRFNDIELVTDKREYHAGENVDLLLNTNQADSTVVLFMRPSNGVYLAPKIVHLKGKSVHEQIAVAKKDMPNFFIEAFTVNGGKVFSETREVIVPPEKRIINVETLTSSKTYKPGEKAKLTLKLTDQSGEPVSGSMAISVYDKSVEYISGGSNVPEIRSHFWKWRRTHYTRTVSSLDHYEGPLALPNEIQMQYLGAFGYQVAQGECVAMDGARAKDKAGFGGGGGAMTRGARRELQNAAPAAPMAAAKSAMAMEEGASNKERSFDAVEKKQDRRADETGEAAPEVQMAEATVRKNFADTAFWLATLNTDVRGIAEVEWPMPENLTTWKIKVWSMSSGTRVGQGESEVVTSKDLIVRLQAPRFFTQKDEVVISANVHNYLKSKKSVQVSLELDGGVLEAPAGVKRTVEIDATGEKRIDWRVKVLAPGEAVLRVKALTDEESDAMEMRFPAYVHGMSKTDSFSGNIRPEKDSASIAMVVPAERRAADTRLEIRYSPTLAGAMVDALPYLVEYPYGCTEQTLNRFLPTVITQKVLNRMNIDLVDVRNKITNLNAQEIGDDVERAKQWKRYARNPVFDEKEVREMVQAGVTRLSNMQVHDGGWGWFSGFGEYSYPHTTAYVVHGLQIARNNDAPVDNNILQRGIEWLRRYQDQQVQWIKNAPAQTTPYKEKADNLDAFVYMVLNDAKIVNVQMRDFLYRDRTTLAVYAKSMFAIALHRQKQIEMRDMLIKNIEQFLVQDDENQTAYLKLPDDNYWWYWYGSEYEAQAYYLKLLAATDPKGEKASRLVKYLINNRKHASYWNSTRDTAVCVEALAEYLTASGEDFPDYTLDILVDGKQVREIAINKSNLFTFNNQFVMTGEALSSGKHSVEFKKKGTGAVYFNAYLTNFTLEDSIKSAGLEVKVNRKYYKLNRVDKTIKAKGAHGQAVDEKVEKYARQELPDLATLKSGDLVEIELEIDSKNDYEYILFEDMKAAGFEPVDTRSGYNSNSLGAYMELRDERVCFFVRALARGKHSVSYRMRAEIPGKFSALPTRCSAMYAPELKANSDEIKLNIED